MDERRTLRVSEAIREELIELIGFETEDPRLLAVEVTEVQVSPDGRHANIRVVVRGNQKEQKLKFEVLVPVISAEDPTAVCSFNFHQEHFGSTFDIRTQDGNVANTACLGFGLERIVMALFKTHGFDTEKWPKETRQLLWP